MRILVVDDEKNIRTLTALALEEEGHQADTADSSRVALKKLGEEPFDAAFVDLRLGDEDGLELLPKMLQINPNLAVIMFTAYGTVGTAVEAMRLGAFDYLEKPFRPEQLRRVLLHMQKTRQLQGRVAELESRIMQEQPDLNLNSDEPAMQRISEVAFKAAATPATILILGESGTGKSVLARAVHQRSTRQELPFITVSCPSLSRELLESELFGHVRGAFTGAVGDTRGKVHAADGGTLFLDEIGELPLEIQPKLLRLLQEREYERVGENKIRRADVRIVAATNRDLKECVTKGTFREDLYYRLNVISFRLPSLRERGRDLMRFAEDYLGFFARQTRKTVQGYTPSARALMQNYPWPGNLRELRNAVERAVILCMGEWIEDVDLPEQMRVPDNFAVEETPAEEAGATDSGAFAHALQNGFVPGGQVTLEELEREHIQKVLSRASSFETAARILGIDPATLYRKRKRMRLK
jgi:NtrC-family two-component system response regulator AlgB